MTEEILQDITTTNFSDWANSPISLIDKNANLRVRLSGDGRDLRITDLTHALKHGKSCVQMYFDMNHGHMAHNLLLKAGSLATLFNLALELDWETHKTDYGYNAIPFSLEEIRARVHRTDRSSTRVFSPLNLDCLPPLKSRPEKWTLSHLKRALASRQIPTIRTRYRLTDDYACDAAANFDRGHMIDPHDLLRQIVESPSGWKCYSDRDNPNILSISCHSNHSLSGHFYLKPEQRHDNTEIGVAA